MDGTRMVDDGACEEVALVDKKTTSSNGRPLMKKALLKCIKKSNVEGVRVFFESEGIDPTACDEIGRTAIVVAIDKGNPDMIKCLLELQPDIGDALFYAVDIRNVQAVRLICKNVPQSTKSEIINAFPTGCYFQSTLTPLLLAGKNNDFDVMKLLLQHGAKMPDLADVLLRAEGDGYLKFLAMVHWYEAASSEALILLTSDDPLDTIFMTAKELEEAAEAMHVPLFGVECERMQAKLADLSIKLLILAKDTQEIGALLRGGQSETLNPKVPLRIHQALEIDSFKTFVSHPSCQAYMTKQYEIPAAHITPFLRKHPRFVRSYVFSLLIMLLYPVLCVLYILLPMKYMAFIKAPKTNYLLHMASRISLLVLLVLTTTSDIVNLIINADRNDVDLDITHLARVYIYLNARPLGIVVILIMCWVFGMTYRMLKYIFRYGAEAYFRSYWNCLNALQLIFYWIFTIAGMVSYFTMIERARMDNITMEDLTSNTVSFSGNESSLPDGSHRPTTMYDWNDFRAQLVSEAAFSVANVLSFLQILHHLIALSFLGPLLISFGGMIYDVIKFFIIFIFLMVSFGIGLTQLYRTFEALDVMACKLGEAECEETPFLTFGKSMITLFWSLFNVLDRTKLGIQSPLGVMTESVGGILYSAFLVVGSLVLLNALIAMMSNTYSRVEENSQVEWKVARVRIMAEYISEKSSMPPPFNLVPTVKSVIWLCTYIRRKCFRGTQRNSQMLPSGPSTGTGCLYKNMSLALRNRRIKAIHIEDMLASDGTDVNDMKKTIEMLSSNVSEIQEELTNIVKILNVVAENKVDCSRKDA